MFRIGQRVRIKYSISWPELAGKEATVLSALCPTRDITTNQVCDGYLVGPDVWGGKCEEPGGKRKFGAAPEQLEPIVDDGRKVITWKDMENIWSPYKNPVPA